ncbi:hypothetical protein DFJ74DRAFT_681891 [Hyaloraphidium curvatum]|nr:hypothetical protein DFJ74DRAFT_681891 [Hyaloraphidium curvatum]
MPANSTMRSGPLLCLLLVGIGLLARDAAAAGDLEDCLRDPSAAECRDARYPPDRAAKDLDALCDAMPFMSGCSVRSLCRGAGDGMPALCGDPFVALASVCLKDMPRMHGCSSFTALCAANSTVRQCADASQVASLVPTTAKARDGVWSICGEMDMEGCQACPKKAGRSFPDCDILATYSQLCVDMPGMEQCRDFGWDSMCAAEAFHSSAFCTAEPLTGVPLAPAMKMFFHFGLADYVLIRAWVPRTGLQYAATLAVVFLAAVGYQVLDIALGNAIPAMSRPSVALVDNGEPATQRGVSPNAVRALAVAGMKLYGYCLMLIAMTFNVGLFAALISGVAVGEYYYGSKRLAGGWDGEGKCC